jgi:4-hydroxy-2-oxoheptanedioate aldolase
VATSMANKVWAAKAAARTAIGMSIKAPSDRNVACAARAGMDFVRFDLAKNCVQEADLAALIMTARNLNLTPLVRIDKRGQIAGVFRDGALGVTLPRVNTADEAAELAALCRVAGSHLGEQLLVSLQIESTTALDDVQAIAAVDGIHMLQSGRNDLAKSMGFPGQPNHPNVLEAEEKIADAASRAGKMTSLHFAPGPESIGQARAWIARGIAGITIGADTQILDEAVQLRVAAIAGVQPGAAMTGSGAVK